VIYEVAQSMVDNSGSERSSWTLPSVDHLHLSIVLNGLVDELRVSVQ
jgi:hypothetical protein